MARKRAPGGGRKPQGEFRGKSRTLTTRITAETRLGLEREAERSGRSLSQEIEHRLRDSINMPKHIEQAWGKPHVYALARLISYVVTGIEVSTRRSWRKDAFTGRAVRAATDIIFARLVPDGPVEVPDTIERGAQSVGRILPSQAEHLRTPEGVGGSHALGALDALLTHDFPPLGGPTSVGYGDNFSVFPRLRKALALTDEDKQ
jgi:hypothetical protein